MHAFRAIVQTHFKACIVGCAITGSIVMSETDAWARPTPLGTSFTYQGQLKQGAALVNSTVDLKFTLFDAAAAGNLIGAPLSVNAVVVTNGLFTLPLDFGAAAFSGDDRWLEIGVNATPNGGLGPYVTLSPRQKLTATPYALMALKTPIAGLPTGGIWALTSALNVGRNAMTVDPANNRVGVGTATPAEKFSVAGNVRIDDGFVSQFRAGQQAAFQFSLATGLINVLETPATGTFTMASGASASDGSGFIELSDKDTGSVTALVEGDNDQNSANGTATGAVAVRSIGPGGPGGKVTVQNNDGSDMIKLVGGPSAASGTFSMLNATAQTTVRALGDVAGAGGELRTADESGNYQSIVQPDINGGGVFVFWARNTSADGLTFDGNMGGSGNPRLDLQGANPSTFNTNAAGNASVVLPADAIAATETLDEPGVANIHANTVALTSTLAAVASRSITVPAAGYVLVLAQGDLQINHTTLGMNCNYGVSAASNSLPADQDVQTQIPAALSAGTYDFSASAHGLFDVSAAGSFTYFFVASKSNNADTANMFDIQLTLVYFPTAYGTVVPNLLPPSAMRARSTGVAADDNDVSQARPPLSPEDIAAEQAEGMAFHKARLESEMAAMKAQLAELQAHLEQVEREQGLIRQLPATPPEHMPASNLAGANRPHPNG